MEITRRCLDDAVAAVRPEGGWGCWRGGAATGREAGFGVVREFVGHGIGRALHEEPQVPNYGEGGPRSASQTGPGDRDRANDHRRQRGEFRSTTTAGQQGQKTVDSQPILSARWQSLPTVAVCSVRGVIHA